MGSLQRSIGGLYGSSGLITPGSKNTRFGTAMEGSPSSPTVNYASVHEEAVGLVKNLSLSSAIIPAYTSTLTNNVIGRGLSPIPRVKASELGLSEDETNKIEEKLKFHYATFCDMEEATWEQNMSLGEAEKTAFRVWIESGDFFFMMPTVERAGFPYGFCVKFIAPGLVRNPDDISVHNKDIFNGIERDSQGRDRNYWIANFYEEDGGEVIPSTLQKHKPYPIRDAETGERYIYHMRSTSDFGQRRGLPPLAKVASLIHAVTLLTEAELVSAIVASFFTVFITDDSPYTDAMPSPFSDGHIDTRTGAVVDPSDIDEDAEDGGYEDIELKLSSGNIYNLPGSKKITTASPNKESENYPGFVEAIEKQIFAAGGVSIEVVLQYFSQSYSASRAAALNSFKTFHASRTTWYKGFSNRIYEKIVIRLAELKEIPADVEKMKRDPYYRHLWTNVQWLGPVMGSIRPGEEAEAARIRLETNVTTRDYERTLVVDEVDNLDMNATIESEREWEAKMHNRLNQEYPLGTQQKITTARSFHDIDNDGSGDPTNILETNKAIRSVYKKNVVEKVEDADNDNDNEGGENAK